LSKEKELQQMIDDAVGIIIRFGGIDGEHHKTWVLDQAVRALTGCQGVSRNENNVPDHFEANEAYRALIADACDGEDGPNTYEWDEGIPP
jgi:hypothetical protein